MTIYRYTASNYGHFSFQICFYNFKQAKAWVKAHLNEGFKLYKYYFDSKKSYEIAID